jgi:hypothetical protein
MTRDARLYPLAAIDAGVTHVEGTLNGYGELSRKRKMQNENAESVSHDKCGKRLNT